MTCHMGFFGHQRPWDFGPMGRCGPPAGFGPAGCGPDRRGPPDFGHGGFGLHGFGPRHHGFGPGHHGFGPGRHGFGHHGFGHHGHGHGFRHMGRHCHGRPWPGHHGHHDFFGRREDCRFGFGRHNPDEGRVHRNRQNCRRRPFEADDCDYCECDDGPLDRKELVSIIEALALRTPSASNTPQPTAPPAAPAAPEASGSTNAQKN